MSNGFRSILGRRVARSSASRGRVFNGVLECLEARRLMSATGVMSPLYQMEPMTSGGSFNGYTPAQISSVYAFNHITLPNGTKAGAGQTIAIIDAYSDPNITSDLATFDSQYSLAAPPSFKIVSETGSTSSLPASNASWGVEITLDVEWAHAMAPGANIMLVEANSANDSDLLTAVNYARDYTGVSVVSMSWGGPDFSGQTSYDSDFTTPSGHAPVTFIAASGDVGSTGGADWPADSPNVLGVGGTTLSVSSSNLYVSETGWADSTGGVSTQETEPTYQDAAETAAKITGGHRAEPDVSYDANTSSGFALYDSLASGGLSGWYIAGGTSAGSPQWASLIAIADQLRVHAGKTTLDGPTVTLPTLYAAYASKTSYAADFHDPTSGSSGTYSAKVGYDEVTGIGSPIASAVVQSLISGTTAAVVTSAVASAVTSSATHSLARYPKNFNHRNVVFSFADNAPEQGTSNASPAALPASGARLLDSVALTYTAPGATVTLSGRFSDNPISSSFGPAVAADNSTPDAFDAVTNEDDVEIPDPTSSDAPLDANHPYSHITEALPAADESSTTTTATVAAGDTHASSIYKAAAAIGLTALLVTLASSQSPAQSKRGADSNSLADLEMLSL